MPSEPKPLFRADALRPKLVGFALPAGIGEARKKLAQWVELLADKKAETLKESELLPGFLTDLFEGLLGFTGPASGAPTYTLKREALIQVDGKYADAALGRFSLAGDKPEFFAAVEGKGPRDPLDRPFAGRRLSAVDQALRYAVNLQCDWYLVTNLREIRVYHKGHDQFTFERFETAGLIDNETALRKFVFLLGAVRMAPAKGRCHLDDLLADSQKIGLDLTRDYYREYSHLRREMFNLLRLANKEIPSTQLLGTTQKILDRVLFIAFCKKFLVRALPVQMIPICYRGKGSGMFLLSLPQWEGNMAQEPQDESNARLCWACNGTGRVTPFKRCPNCKGSGLLTQPSTGKLEQYGSKLSYVSGQIYKDDARGNRRWNLS